MRVSFSCAILLFTTLCGQVLANVGLHGTLVPSLKVVAPGAKVFVEKVVFNSGPVAAKLEQQPVLHGTVYAEKQSWPVTLQAEAAYFPSVASGAFAARSYSFTMPAEVSGRVYLELKEDDSVAPCVLRVDPALIETQPPGSSPTQPYASPFEVKRPAASAIERSFAGRLSAHDSIYFIYGPDKPAAKFQFSFKYRALDFSRSDIPNSLHFAFTQRSLWNITDASSPFYDTSYMPELFFESLALMPKTKGKPFTWLGYQSGYKHESNGRDEDASRSLNTLFVRGAVAFGSLEGWHLLAIPELYAYISDLSNNPDIGVYRGNGKLRLVLGKGDGPALMAAVIPGRGFKKTTLQLDLSLPFNSRMLSLQAYFLIQYFNGYGEGLLSYRNRSDTVRAGVSVVR